MKKGLIHGKGVNKHGEHGPFFDIDGTGALKYVESDYNVEKKLLTAEHADHIAK